MEFEDIIIPDDPTPNEIVTLTAKASALMALAGKAATDARKEYKQAKSAYEFEYSKAYLAAEGTIEERKAHAKVKTYELEKLMIVAEDKWKLLEQKVKDYENAFVALRKIGSIRETEMKTIR
jgi:erythromycin esterase-like protein